MAAAQALRCAFLTGDDAALQGSALLGALRFCSTAADPLPASAALQGAPCASLAMPALDDAGASEPAWECWSAGDAAQYGSRGPVRYAHDGELLFGIAQLREESFPASAGATPLQQASQAAYEAIFGLAAALGYPHLLRFWNYMADINGESHGLERYRQFNLGRQEGFGRGGRATEGARVPAASAVGFDAGPLTVCFLAAREAAPTAIENPRQVSAYSYPSQYGPRSPTFSRAGLVRFGNAHALLISGTASIVGHRTLHAGDVVAQARETVANLAAVLEQANRAAPAARFALSDLYCKVYVRHAADVAAVRAELRRCMGENARLLFLRADICRQDLLVEIEASAGHPVDFAPGAPLR